MKSKIPPASMVLISVLVIATGSSCAVYVFKLKVAMNRLHAQLKESDFKTIYREASPEMWRRETEDEFVTKLRITYARVGEIESVEKDTDNPYLDRIVSTGQDSKLSTKLYKLKGSKESCGELIIWAIQGDEVKLFSYECLFFPK
jgi:hypothetical protein